MASPEPFLTRQRLLPFTGSRPMRSTVYQLLKFVTCCLMVGIATPAMADPEVTIGSGIIAPGGNLELQIGIESDAPPEDMSSYNLVLQITPLTVNGDSSLQFVNSQSETFLEDADYVFADTSEVIELDDTAVKQNDGDVIEFEDLSVDGMGFETNVEVTSGQLLASVNLEHLLGSTLPGDTAGNQYLVSVDEIDSVFLNEAGDELELFSVSGLVTVQATAIPEPSSVALLLLATCGVTMRRRRPVSR